MCVCVCVSVVGHQSFRLTPEIELNVLLMVIMVEMVKRYPNIVQKGSVFDGASFISEL